MKNCFDAAKKISFLLLILTFSAASAFAQAGRRSPVAMSESDGLVPVVVSREGDSKEPVKAENFAVYENGVEQKIKAVTFDATPARIVLLVDNSQTLRTDVAKMTAAAKEFAYEIYEGDQIFVAAYDEKAEIIEEWTDDAKKIEKSLATFRKKGNPRLFDSLSDVLEQVVRPLMPAVRKTAVVIVSDGLDRGSAKTFERVLADYQSANVAIYAIQIPDRTGGAYRRNQPKPEAVIQKLTEGTGGKVLDFADSQTAAKAMCDELKNNRYLLAYQPLNGGGVEARRLFVVADKGINVRTKTTQPPNIK
ncbi:MAG TPA: VWA domain-containing protein [Pyrinomonadaceae bacterium]|nr:VWA domain-containing protein [Pyrinomonadaceae bacterium]